MQDRIKIWRLECCSAAKAHFVQPRVLSFFLHRVELQYCSSLSYKNLQDNITLLYMYSAQRHVFPFCSKLPAVIYSFFTQSESLIALFEPFCFLVRQVYIVVFLFYQCC